MWIPPKYTQVIFIIPILGTHPEGGHLIKGTLYNTISVRGVDLFIDYRPFLLFYFFSIPGKSDEKHLEKKVSLFADRG